MPEVRVFLDSPVQVLTNDGHCCVCCAAHLLKKSSKLASGARRKLLCACITCPVAKARSPGSVTPAATLEHTNTGAGGRQGRLILREQTWISFNLASWPKEQATPTNKTQGKNPARGMPVFVNVGIQLLPKDVKRTPGERRLFPQEVLSRRGLAHNELCAELYAVNQKPRTRLSDVSLVAKLKHEWNWAAHKPLHWRLPWQQAPVRVTRVSGTAHDGCVKI